MGKSELNISDLIKQLSENNEEMYSTACKVDKVNGDTVDVTPIDGKAPILGVRLVSESTDTNFVCYPSEGSVVLVTFLSKENAFVSLASSLDSVKIRGDKFGGLIKINELVKQLDIVTSRIDTLYDAINNASAASYDGGATLQSTMKATLAAQIETEDFGGIENKDITHG